MHFLRKFQKPKDQTPEDLRKQMLRRCARHRNLWYAGAAAATLVAGTFTLATAGGISEMLKPISPRPSPHYLVCGQTGRLRGSVEGVARSDAMAFAVRGVPEDCSLFVCSHLQDYLGRSSSLRLDSLSSGTPVSECNQVTDLPSFESGTQAALQNDVENRKKANLAAVVQAGITAALGAAIIVLLAIGPIKKAQKTLDDLCSEFQELPRPFWFNRLFDKPVTYHALSLASLAVTLSWEWPMPGIFGVVATISFAASGFAVYYRHHRHRKSIHAENPPA